LLIEQEAPSFDEQNRCEREFPRNSDLKAQLSYIGSVIYFASKRRGKPIKARATQWFAVLFAVKECLSKHGELMEGGLASQTGIRASRFIQMHTGEGKALVIVIIAMYFSGRGYHVDIVTNSDQLALDAVREYGYLYSTFRSSCRALLTTSHNNKETVAVYEANIVYGTLLSFAADHLRESLSFRKVTGNRSRSLLIIDEVDSIVIDRATDSNMLSAPIFMGSFTKWSNLMANTARIFFLTSTTCDE
uniref:Uncharacterized protein n=1 Tax=Globisporangium ultimum (strain ATCC 200006 / CBS 805.95 / DAOM BR144) TaxID=431595 RepID=K3X1L5_GLOUD